MNKSIFLLISFFIFALIAQSAVYAGPTPATAYVPNNGAPQCDADAFYDALGQSESGGCGGGNQYNCTGPVISSGMHAGDRPLGKYQFMPKTLAGMGISTSGFVGNAAAQDAAIRQFTADNDACLERNGAYNHIGTVRNGVEITRSGLLGAAHLGGCGGAARWARGGGAASDQLGTSLADYAGKFQGYGMFGDVPGGTCGGGVANAADIFAEAQARGYHEILGCDPDILEKNKTIIDAVNQVNAEIGKANIQQPTSIEQMTCADQTAELYNQAGGIHSQPANGNISGSLGPLAQMPLMQTIQRSMGIDPATGQFDPNSLGGILSSSNPINNVINNAFGNITSSVLGGAGGNSLGGGINTDCGMVEQTWLINQCLDIPKIPSVSEIVGGQMAEITGAIGNFANPERMLEQVCNAANSQIQGLSSNANSAFERAAQEGLSPITDSIQ